MRILICGSRTMDDSSLMRDILSTHFNGSDDVLIHGMAKGADQLSEHVICLLFGLQNRPMIERYPADWLVYGRGAGPIRNKRMLIEGKPELVIAFLASGSKGTKNMIEQAKRAGVNTKIIVI